MYTVMKDGTVLISREESDNWMNDETLRKRVYSANIENGPGYRLFAVCTIGGYVVDVWQIDHWQKAGEP